MSAPINLAIKDALAPSNLSKNECGLFHFDFEYKDSEDGHRSDWWTYAIGVVEQVLLESNTDTRNALVLVHNRVQNATVGAYWSKIDGVQGLRLIPGPNVTVH